MLVFVYILPLKKLIKRVESMGEKFPKSYQILMKYVNPILLLILIIFGITNEFIHPFETPFYGQLLAIGVFACPLFATIVFFIWNPWRPKGDYVERSDFMING
jgi:hypothetical protein